MLSVIIRRSDEPTVIHLTQENIMRELGGIANAEMILADTFREGLRMVRTPFVCMVEGDCTLSANYISSNYNLLKKSTPEPGGKGSGKRVGAGGYTKLAMIASCLGLEAFDNRVYNYRLEKQDHKLSDELSITSWDIKPNREKPSTSLYSAQVGFVPGAMIRFAAIKDMIDVINWDSQNLIEMSTRLSFHLWETGRRVEVNPNTTYVSNHRSVLKPRNFEPNVPHSAAATFTREGF